MSERRLKVFTRMTDFGDDMEIDEPFTIEGVYEDEPTCWSRATDWLRFWGRVWSFRVRYYFSNLWGAICGRCDDY